MVKYASEEEQRFFEAAYNENTRLVARMLTKNPLLANINNGIASPLYIAVRHRCYRMAEILIEHGADVNAGLLEEGDQFSIGDTPLIGSIQSDCIRSFKLLVKHGAKLNIINNWGYCPLRVAIEYYNTNMFKHLLEAGADPNLEAEEGYPVLFYASHISPPSYQPPFLKLLRKFGADMEYTLPVYDESQDGEWADSIKKILNKTQ